MASAEVYYHGTRNEFPFEAIRPSPGDVGIHFGNFRQAKWRVEHQSPESKHTIYPQPVPNGSKIFEVYLDIKNPLEMPDVGNWNDPKVVTEELKEIGVLDKQEAEELSKQDGKAIAKKLQTLGYDAIAYENFIEGTVGGFRREPSGWSVIIFSPSQIKSYRIHSVWEQSDNKTSPRKLNENWNLSGI